MDEIGVVRMNADAADEPRLTEAEMAPGAAGIGRFVNAVAIGYVQPDLGLPGAGINHVGVRAGHGERTDRGGAEKAVADASPINPAINRLPNASGAGSEVEHAAVFGVTGNGYDAAAPRRPDTAPLEGIEFGCRAGELCHRRFLCPILPATLTGVVVSGRLEPRRRISSRPRRAVTVKSGHSQVEPADGNADRWSREPVHPVARRQERSTLSLLRPGRADRRNRRGSRAGSASAHSRGRGCHDQDAGRSPDQSGKVARTVRERPSGTAQAG